MGGKDRRRGEIRDRGKGGRGKKWVARMGERRFWERRGGDERKMKKERDGDGDGEREGGKRPGKGVAK